MQTKTCTLCHQTKELSQFYRQASRSKDGHASRCKVCSEAHNKNYRATHPQTATRMREYLSVYRADHRLEHLLAGRRYYQEHREELLQKALHYQRDHPEVVSTRNRNRLAREHTALGSHTTEEFLILCKYMEWRCTYCGCDLTLTTVTADHMIPLSRGGSNAIDNLTPSCLSCNASKGAKTVEEFLCQPPL